MSKPKPKRTKKYDATRWLRTVADRNERRADAKPLEQARATTIAIGHHIAFDLLLKAPTDDAWHDVGAALNMCLVLCEQGFGAEHLEAVKASMVGLMRARARYAAGGSLALDGDAIKGIRFALTLHDEQLAVADRADLRKAARETVRRVESDDIYADFGSIREAA